MGPFSFFRSLFPMVLPLNAVDLCPSFPTFPLRFCPPFNRGNPIRFFPFSSYRLPAHSWGLVGLFFRRKPRCRVHLIFASSPPPPTRCSPRLLIPVFFVSLLWGPRGGLTIPSSPRGCILRSSLKPVHMRADFFEFTFQEPWEPGR